MKRLHLRIKYVNRLYHLLKKYIRAPFQLLEYPHQSDDLQAHAQSLASKDAQLEDQ